MTIVQVQFQDPTTLSGSCGDIRHSFYFFLPEDELSCWVHRVLLDASELNSLLIRNPREGCELHTCRVPRPSRSFIFLSFWGLFHWPNAVGHATLLKIQTNCSAQTVGAGALKLAAFSPFLSKLRLFSWRIRQFHDGPIL